MKLYLDNSFLNRPFDDQAVGLNQVESEVLQAILQLARSKKVSIVNSAVIMLENSVNSLPERKTFIEQVLKQARYFQNVTTSVEKRADQCVAQYKLKPIDALHCAAAEAAKAHYMITCDHDLVKKYDGSLKVAKPLEFLYYYYYE